MKGVEWARVGYSGGKKSFPTYRSIGDHTEVIQVKFDPEQISFERLLDTFFAKHTGWYSACSSKQQYNSGIWYQNEEQLAAIKKKISEVEAESGRKVRSRIEPLGPFYMGEEYHQKYYDKQFGSR